MGWNSKPRLGELGTDWRPPRGRRRSWGAEERFRYGKEEVEWVDEGDAPVDDWLTFIAKLCGALAFLVVAAGVLGAGGARTGHWLRTRREPSWASNVAATQAMLARHQSEGGRMLAGAAEEHRRAVASAITEFLEVEEHLNGVSAPRAEAELASIVRSVVVDEISKSHIRGAAPRAAAAASAAGAPPRAARARYDPAAHMRPLGRSETNDAAEGLAAPPLARSVY